MNFFTNLKDFKLIKNAIYIHQKDFIKLYQNLNLLKFFITICILIINILTSLFIFSINKLPKFILNKNVIYFQTE